MQCFSYWAFFQGRLVWSCEADGHKCSRSVPQKVPHQSPLESWQYRCRAAPPPGISCTGSRLLGRTKTATEREEEKWTKQKDQTGIFVKYHHDFKHCRNSKQKRVNSTIHSLLMGKQKKLHRPWTTLSTLSLMYPFTSCAHWFIYLFTIWWGLWAGWCGWVAAPRCSLRLWDKKKHWLTFRNKMFITCHTIYTHHPA